MLAKIMKALKCITLGIIILLCIVILCCMYIACACATYTEGVSLPGSIRKFGKEHGSQVWQTQMLVT